MYEETALKCTKVLIKRKANKQKQLESESPSSSKDAVHTRYAYVTFKHGKYLLRTDQEDERIYVRQPRSQMCTVTGSAG
jgi:hypothetical protein